MLSSIAIAIVLACDSGIPIGVFTRHDNIQRSYNIIQDPSGIITILGLDDISTPEHFTKIMKLAREQVPPVKTTFLETPTCKKKPH